MSVQYAESIVVMGVAAAGKTSVGSALAHHLGYRFIDGDDLHPEANKRKMSQGVPLDDADRTPWLARVGAELHDSSEPLVVTCSALKRAYRDQIRRVAPGTVFVHLTGTVELLEARMAARTGHFMPPSLLVSQLATIEDLGNDEAGFAVDVAGNIDQIVDETAARLQTQAYSALAEN
ncbi:gluconokinase [Microbacterium sp. K24]|uniref:gluconokinase n=1 Tax=Microbacterium sp. K24 TaxID=2305446 RepID=UPI001F0CF0BE|nr:gluconokinase [Microbacterium sp. K24]